MTNNGGSLDKRTFRKLSSLYIIALSAIALSVIISQVIIRNYLNDQQSDSTIINVAGRQRMLSQKLTKEILLLSQKDNADNKITITNHLKKTLQIWEISHNALLNGNDSLSLPGNNSEKIVSMFQKIQPYYETILNASNNIIYKIENSSTETNSELASEIALVSNNEGDFLQLMDKIVNQYNIEASKKVDRLRHLELLLMFLTLTILLGEFLFIFWPTAKVVKEIILKLLKSEQKAMKIAYDTDVLREKNEQSVKEIRALNQIMDETLLFARIASDGTTLHVGKKFSELFKLSRFNEKAKFPEIISIHKSEQQVIENLLANYSKIGWQGEVKATTKDKRTIWLEMYIIPFNSIIDKSELLIMCSYITERKQAQLELELLTKKNYEEKMNQQKVISSKIIENQEKEQNRIAKDIHDGIGQMLTALKFNLESINLNDQEKSAAKIENLKTLALNIIQGVRTATFNLTPPELSDHGITPALSKLTRELSKLTGKNILLYNKTDFNKRLNSLSEINIYRITQEAINNAIKYACSTHIIVSISHSEQLLSIIIDDNGKGFDPEKIKNKKDGIGGMGMTFMKERIKYIDGRLFMNSSPENGTRITLNIPLDKNLDSIT
ncbi:MAG: type IV pili methyl-accepting chemotaxis transducer N-terminal domain-containing protein [Labilibaculum sp.]|nr:type IV pili methyl-accepting chemotaxis transducer N-terminal domain-containing protein [Labilibaculum sp.]